VVWKSSKRRTPLLSELTDILLRNEGADPADPRARAIAKVFLHRPTAVYDPDEGRRYSRERLAERHAAQTAGTPAP
jgi:hypothetical protein